MSRSVDAMNHVINDLIKRASDKKSLKLSDDEIEDLKTDLLEYTQDFFEQLALRLLKEMGTR